MYYMNKVKEWHRSLTIEVIGMLVIVVLTVATAIVYRDDTVIKIAVVILIDVLSVVWSLYRGKNNELYLLELDLIKKEKLIQELEQKLRDAGVAEE